MKRNHLIHRAAICLLAFASTVPLYSVHAQGTTFTYQGRLNDVGLPANGRYDLMFSVYDSSTAGTLVGGPFINTSIISNGLFTVNLDFGASTFNGSARWLEVGVRTNGGGSFATFGSRQAILPGPYSMFAATASNVVSGSVVKSINNLKDNVTLSAGANVTITPSGNSLIVSSSGPGGAVWSLNGTSTYYNGGNVGIGTSTPQGLLDVNCGGSDTSAFFIRGDPSVYGRGGIIHHQSSTYGWQELAQVTGSATDGYLAFNYVNRTAPGTKVSANVMALRGNGNVGIGTTTPVARLDITASGGELLHLTANGPVLTFYDSAHALSRVALQSINGGLNFLSQNYLAGAAPYGFMSMDNSGNIGIGSANPASKLDIASTGGDMMHLIGYEPYLSIYDSNHGYTHGVIQSVGGSLNFFTDSYLAGIAPLNCMMLHNNGNVGIGTLNPQAKLEVIGAIRTCVLTITGGCDVAEPFDMDSEDTPKGAVVVIDDEKPGRLKLSRAAYDTRVAGIVSGANGINAGISLQQAGTFEAGQNVALSGRVYVQADASFGAIKAGDLLTTSDTPGHAMKVSDHAKAQGAILGKAMSSLKEGKGLVLVLVTLQ